MQVLPDGDISKLMKGTGFRLSLRRPYGTGISPDPSALDELREDSDEKLFLLSRYNPNHVLHRLLPNLKTPVITFIPTDISAVIKQNFVYRMLFRDIY